MGYMCPRDCGCNPSVVGKRTIGKLTYSIIEAFNNTWIGWEHIAKSKHGINCQKLLSQRYRTHECLSIPKEKLYAETRNYRNNQPQRHKRVKRRLFRQFLNLPGYGTGNVILERFTRL